MSKVPAPHEVFTPGELPLEARNVYATRAEPEAELERFIDRSQIPVVFGEYGVGKSSLVHRFLRDKPKGRVVNIPSAADQTLSSVFKHVLEELGFVVESRIETKAEVSGSFSLQSLIARAGMKATGSQKVTADLVVSSPTDLGMLRVMADARVVLVIDEMHRATTEFRQELANFIKAIKSTGNEFPRLVLIGTTMDAEHLVARDPGIDRYVKELPLPLMTEGEAAFIVTEGFKRLALQIDPDLVDRVVRTAAGAPYIVQSLCLDMADSAIARPNRPVADDDYRAAVSRYLRDHGRRLAAAYMKAVEHTGEKRWRRRVLHAVARVPLDYATGEQIRKNVIEDVGEDVDAVDLGKPLKQLKDERFGAILQDVERFEGGRLHNFTAFRDPMMKSFIRFMKELDQQGLLPSPDELA